MITDDMPLVQLLAVLVAGLGALNWGLKELMSTDLLVELVPADMLGISYIVVGIAGAVVLVDMLDLVADNGAETSPLED